jgi:hypothetical protein
MGVSDVATNGGAAEGVAPAESRRPLVFLCHSSRDKAQVRELYWRLKNDGFEPWLDSENLLPGQDWNLEIRRAVRRADVVVVCLTAHAVSAAGFRHKEIKLALDVADEKPEGTIYVVPVKLEECVPPERLAHLHFVALFKEGGYQRLVAALREQGAGGGGAPAAPTEPARSLEHISGGKNRKAGRLVVALSTSLAISVAGYIGWRQARPSQICASACLTDWTAISPKLTRFREEARDLQHQYETLGEPFFRGDRDALRFLTKQIDAYNDIYTDLATNRTSYAARLNRHLTGEREIQHQVDNVFSAALDQVHRAGIFLMDEVRQDATRVKRKQREGSPDADRDRAESIERMRGRLRSLDPLLAAYESALQTLTHSLEPRS